MAGILDSKQRIMDTIITKEGRRQVPSGELKIKYVSFTDRHTFYQDCGDGCAENPDDRIQLEAISRLQDQIIFETDDEGNLLSFEGNDIKIYQGGYLARTPDGSTNNELVTEDHSVTAELVNELLSGVEDNFKNQQIIATFDQFTETSALKISPTEMKFRVTDRKPIRSTKITEASVDDIECLYQDKRLQHLPFYQYLPPVNKTRPYEDEGQPLGNYPRLNQPAVLTIGELEEKLKPLESEEFRFLDTSRENNIVMQVLESGTGKIEKLALIDFGEFPNEDPYSPGKHVFFVGKVFSDGADMHTYVNIFTVILE